MNRFRYFCYTLILGVWTGGILMFTFVVTPILFRSFGRDTAGTIVGKLFPGYFLFTLIAASLALLLFFTVRMHFSRRSSAISLMLIALAIMITLYTNLHLHPQMQALKKDIVSFETVSPEDPLRKRFRRLHAVSALLNLLLLADGVALLAAAAMSRQEPS